MRFRTRAIMLTWAPYSGRSEGLARHLGIRNHFVHYLAFQRPWVAPLKYPLQAAATLRLLWRERPAVPCEHRRCQAAWLAVRRSS